jgi:CHAD domain-containing protein
MTQRGDTWLDQLSSRACITEVARVAIPRRLETVFEYVPLVARHADRSDEYVHQLRVSTRRAQTVISLCASVLPSKQTEEWQRTLRGFRRAAGAVRDFDVLLQRLGELQPGQPISLTDRDAIVHWLRARRAGTLVDSVGQVRKLARRRNSRRWRELVSKVRWPGLQPEPLAHDVFEAELRRLARRFFRQGAEVMRTKPARENMAELHQLRISAKRLRYTVESVCGVFDDRLVESHQLIKTIQTRLGRIHDHANASAFLRAEGPPVQPADLRPVLDTLATYESEAMQAGLEEWSAWWIPARLDHFWNEWHEVVGGKHWSSKQPA